MQHQLAKGSSTRQVLQQALSQAQSCRPTEQDDGIVIPGKGVLGKHALSGEVGHAL